MSRDEPLTIISLLLIAAIAVASHRAFLCNWRHWRQVRNLPAIVGTDEELGCLSREWTLRTATWPAPWDDVGGPMSSRRADLYAGLAARYASRWNLAGEVLLLLAAAWLGASLVSMARFVVAPPEDLFELAQGSVLDILTMYSDARYLAAIGPIVFMMLGLACRYVIAGDYLDASARYATHAAEALKNVEEPADEAIPPKLGFGALLRRILRGPMP